MATKLSGGKIAAIILVLLVGAFAAFGYFKQTATLDDASKTTEANAADSKAKPDASLLAVKPNDIILGDNNALVTVIEYSSLSCTHCAHFHETVLPDFDKEFITTGKVRLVLRHFPLNPPALKATELVECGASGSAQKANFMKVLFTLQPKWAFDDNYLKNLKQIAGVGGVDSAAFDSCMDDKDLETKIIASRQEAQEKIGVDSTPTFFINGVKYEGDRTIEGFRKAIADASPKGE